MKHILNLSLCLFFVTSCSKQSIPTTNDFNPYVIKKIGIIQPFVNVDVISTKKEEKTVLYDWNIEITENTTKAVSSFLVGNGMNAERLDTLSDEENKILQKEIESYFKILSNDGRILPIDRANDVVQPMIREIKVSNEFTQVFKKHKLPYAISTLAYGFTRTKNSNRNRQIALNIARVIGIPAWFFIFPYIKNPQKNSLTVYCFLIDIENQKIIMYNAKEKSIDPAIELESRGLLFEALYEYWTLEKRKAYFQKQKTEKTTDVLSTEK